MLLFLAGIFSSGGAISGADLVITSVSNIFAGTCYSAISFGTDGVLRTNQGAGGSSTTAVEAGNWLLVGSATSYYIEYELTADTFDLDDCGGENTRVQMGGTLLRFNIAKSATGTRQTDAIFKIYNHPSAGDLIVSGTISFIASAN